MVSHESSSGQVFHVKHTNPLQHNYLHIATVLSDLTIDSCSYTRTIRVSMLLQHSGCCRIELQTNTRKCPFATG
ncbi:unnamed protein product [Urochloa humidicola]